MKIRREKGGQKETEREREREREIEKKWAKVKEWKKERKKERKKENETDFSLSIGILNEWNNYGMMYESIFVVLAYPSPFTCLRKWLRRILALFAFIFLFH